MCVCVCVCVYICIFPLTLLFLFLLFLLLHSPAAFSGDFGNSSNVGSCPETRQKSANLTRKSRRKGQRRLLSGPGLPFWRIVSGDAVLFFFITLEPRVE